MYYVIVPPSTQEDEGRSFLHSAHATAEGASDARDKIVAGSKGYYRRSSIRIAQDLPL